MNVIASVAETKVRVESSTKDALDRDLRHLQVSSGNKNKTFDDLIKDMRSRLLEKFKN